MRVIFSGLAHTPRAAREMASIDASVFLRNTLLSGYQRSLTRLGHLTPHAESHNRLINMQTATALPLYRAKSPLLQQILTGDGGSDMPLFIYRQSEVIA